MDFCCGFGVGEVAEEFGGGEIVTLDIAVAEVVFSFVGFGDGEGVEAAVGEDGAGAAAGAGVEAFAAEDEVHGDIAG